MAIDEKDMELLRATFITRDECNSKNDAVYEEFRREIERLAIIETKLNTIQWLLTTVGAGVIATLIATILSA